MPSQKFLELKDNLRLLRKDLLPTRFDPTGTYNNRVYTKVVAYRVLCHAALEDYFESRATEIASEAVRKVKIGTYPATATHLVSFEGQHLGSPPDSLSPPTQNKAKEWPLQIDIVERIRSCGASFVREIANNNHGIREKNIIRMLIPIGFSPSDFDPVLLSELDSFGRARGQYAHSSASKHVASRPDPKLEYDRVMRILQLLHDVDKKLDLLM